MAKLTTKYWIVQIDEEKYKLHEAICKERFETIPIRSKYSKIKKGDQLILCQLGEYNLLFGIGEVREQTDSLIIPDDELPFFTEKPRLKKTLKVDLKQNICNHPIPLDSLVNLDGMEKIKFSDREAIYEWSESEYNTITQFIDDNNLTFPTRINYPLNLALYGPPKCGKTYQSVNYAVAIIENRPLNEVFQTPYQEIRLRLEQYNEEGLVNFVSFHPSFGYHDFVEGVSVATENGVTSEIVKNGIFKQICYEAKQDLVQSLVAHLPQPKVQIEFGHIYKKFIEFLKSDDFNSFKTDDDKKILLHKVLRFGNIAVRPEKTFSTVNINKKRLQNLFAKYSGTEDYTTIEQQMGHNIGKVNTHIYWSVFQELKRFQENEYQKYQSEGNVSIEKDVAVDFDIRKLNSIIHAYAKRHVLIIKSANQGDILSIFGDMMAMLEVDAREGGVDATSVILPFSKTYFSIPPNLHIICLLDNEPNAGVQLDPILLSKFSFVDINVKPHLLQPIQIDEDRSIDMAAMLTMINKRLSILLGAQYLLGHGYFMRIYELEQLKLIFQTQIIPILKTYFEGDLKMVNIVLGNAFVIKQQLSNGDIFPVDDDSPLTYFELIDVYSLEADAFISIYSKQNLGDL